MNKTDKYHSLVYIYDTVILRPETTNYDITCNDWINEGLIIHYENKKDSFLTRQLKHNVLIDAHETKNKDIIC